jgi:hypothetical protein
MNNTNEALQFKVGDKLRLKADRKSKHPEAFHGRLVVDALLGSNYVGVKNDKGNEGGFFPSELESDGFRVGDRVEFTEDYGWNRGRPNAAVGDQGTVTGTENAEPGTDAKQLVYADMDSGNLVSAFDFRMKHAEAPKVAEESAPEPQPVTYRICVRNDIGKTEYPSEAAAREAALLHGKDGEEFSIWEVVMVAEYKVKVTKSLEAVDAAD